MSPGGNPQKSRDEDFLTGRICIIGGPRAGKTTYAMSLSADARHTDDLIGKLDWHQASEEISKWFDAPEDWIIEGVAVPRALRKWLKAHEEDNEKPCDRIIVLDGSFLELTPGQERMAKGVQTVFDEISDELIRRGVCMKYIGAKGFGLPPALRLLLG
jgi:adenylate kinase family enzyme